MRSDKAVLYVYRQYAEPTAWPAQLEIDGRSALSLQQEGFTWVYVTPGNRNLVYRWPFLAGMPKVEFTHQFEAGKTYAFEMTGKARGAAIFFVTRSAIRELEWRMAIEQLRACCRYVPAKETSF
jgi:hypothetical protein